MKHKGAPIHSIEVQIYKAALEAKKDGIDTLIFGESADVNYGGMSNILSRDWTFDEFVERYSYVNPETVLLNPKFDKEPFRRYLNKDGTENVHNFLRNVFYQESMNSYLNACISHHTPYMTQFYNTQNSYNL